MNLINFILICFQIYFIYKYLVKLKDTNQRLQDNEIDYTEIKLKQSLLEKNIKEINGEIIKLKK